MRITDSVIFARRRVPLAAVDVALALVVALAILVLEEALLGIPDRVAIYTGPVIVSVVLGVALTVRASRFTVQKERLGATIGVLQQANELVEESERSWREILASIPSGVAVVDSDLSVVWANEAATALARDPSAPPAGQKCFVAWHGRETECDECLVRKAFQTGATASGEVEFADRGTFRVTVTPLPNADARRTAVVVFTDVSAHREEQAHLRNTIVDRDLLLRETHHRAKNNLQLVASLVTLTDAGGKREILEELERRILSMAMVHEQLSVEQSAGRTTLRQFLEPLSSSILESLRPPELDLTLRCSLPDIPITTKRAVILGLVVNELITNSVKHGYPDSGQGTITISGSWADDSLAIEYTDDGVGVHHEPITRGSSHGTNLMRDIVTQLGGNVDYNTDHGQGYSVRIDLPAPAQ